MGEKWIDFVGRRGLWYRISGAILLVGLIVLLFNGLNLGIDFTGGTILELAFEEDITVAETRNILAEFGLEDSLIQESGSRTMVIRSQPLDQETISSIHTRMGEEFAGLDILRTEMVGPTIGAELRRNALYALTIAAILMVIYISVRFEFKFAVAAIAALIHDVLFVVGIFALIQWQVNSAFIAGLLTIIGYSINDTIVIFDRIRENRKLYSKKESFGEFTNRSLNDTLARSINTSFTTLLVVVSLFVFGGAIIRPFILTLMLGVIAGTYSSLCVASQILVSWERWERARRDEYRLQES